MFARTARLTLRPGWPEDAPTLARAIAHREVIGRLAHVPWPYAEADAAAFLTAAHPAPDVHLLVWSHEAIVPQLIGGVALVVEAGEHQLGYWLTPSAWGRGYATEAAGAMVQIARHALPIGRLAAYHHLDNPASGRVLRKLGFRQTGRMLRYARGRDAEVDCASFDLDFGRRRSPVPLAA